MSGHLVNTDDGMLKVKIGQNGNTVAITIFIEDPDEINAVAEMTPGQVRDFVLVLQEHLTRIEHAATEIEE